MGNLEGQRRVIAQAEQLVFKKESGELDHLVGKAERAKDPKQIQPTIDQEVKRLKPEGAFDHEEVFAGTNIYTNGQGDGSKPKLSKIKSEKWAKTGE